MAGPFVWESRLPSGSLLGHDLVAFRLGTAARALGEGRLDLLDGLGLGQALHRRDLARQPVERRLVELALRIGLLRLALRPVQVAYHLGDGNDVAGINLGLVFLRPARPHGALDAGAALKRLKRPAHDARLGEFAHADGGNLRGGHAQRHLVLDEVDDEQFELVAGDFLLLDRRDLTDAVSRVHDKLIGLEALTLGGLLQGFVVHHLLRNRPLHGLLGSGTGNRLLGIDHSARYLFTVRPAVPGLLVFGSRATYGAP